ncbi:cytochrome c biogenesis protein CcdA [Candidatus Acetothermia bacterium]|nr:cytochrome c biogenesis protein CcdA [Candidatus Acetothermia bacterium]
MQGTVRSIGSRWTKRQWLTIGFLAFLAFAIAGSWLLFVFVLDGKSLLNEIKFQLQQARTVQMQSITGVLGRTASLSEHVDLTTVYATSEFFNVVRRGATNIPYSPEKSLIFLINEDTHEGELSYDPTPVTLRVDGTQVYKPEKAETLSYSIHHKVSVVSFSKQDSQSGLIVSDRTRSLELVTPKLDHASDHTSGVAVMRWDLPIVYPEGALNGQKMPLGSMIALALGLLATVLTPCLIQLVLYYLSTLTGFSSEQISSGALTAGARKQLLKVALGFVLGFTVLFTAVGALAGYAGETLQSSGLWAAWTRPMAIAAGMVIVLLGIWMAIRAKAPLVCRLPFTRLAQSRDGGFFRSALMGFSFAIGCATCFGGALIATLLLYVGTLGSATEGALILFFFSLGVDIPFLLAAALLSGAAPLLNRLQRAAPVIGLISSVVMIGFGLLLITDKFHLVSGLVYRWILS